MNCNRCGNNNPDSVSFCLECGLALNSGPRSVGLQPAHAAPYGITPAVVDPLIRKPKIPSWRRVAIISVLAVGAGFGLSKLVFFQWNYNATEGERKLDAMHTAEEKIKRGLLLTSIRPSSPAQRSGLREGDIVLRYGDKTVEDITSYVAAAVVQPENKPAALTIFREGYEIKVVVPSGYLGFQFEDWNPVRKRIYERLWYGDKDGAMELAAVAQRDASLTEVQSLILKIMLIPDHSSEEKERERAELLDELLSKYPAMHLFQLARSEFSHFYCETAAARCYEELLARTEKDDVDARLNLALCHVGLFDFDKAEKEVIRVVNRPQPSLSPYGVFVAHEVMGGVALGRNKYREALSHFELYLESGSEYTTRMCLFAAAKLGDLEKFNDIRKQAKVSEENARDLGFDMDVLAAYILAGRGKKEEASALVLKWGSAQCVVDGAVKRWRRTPGGDDIAQRMRSLLKVS